MMTPNLPARNPSKTPETLLMTSGAKKPHNQTPNRFSMPTNLLTPNCNKSTPIIPSNLLLPKFSPQKLSKPTIL